MKKPSVNLLRTVFLIFLGIASSIFSGCITNPVVTTKNNRQIELDKAIIRTEFGSHQGIPIGAGIIHNGKYLATAGSDQTIRIWNTLNGDLINTIRPPFFENKSRMTFSVDQASNTVAYSNGRMIYIYEIDSTGSIKEKYFHEHSNLRVYKLIDHRRLIIINDSRITLFDYRDKLTINSISISNLYSPNISSYGNYLVLSSDLDDWVEMYVISDNKIKLVGRVSDFFGKYSDILGYRKKDTLKIVGTEFSPDGKHFLVKAADLGAVAIVRTEGLIVTDTWVRGGWDWKAHDAAAWTSDGKSLLFDEINPERITKKSSVIEIEVENGKMLRRIKSRIDSPTTAIYPVNDIVYFDKNIYVTSGFGVAKIGVWNKIAIGNQARQEGASQFYTDATGLRMFLAMRESGKPVRWMGYDLLSNEFLMMDHAPKLTEKYRSIIYQPKTQLAHTEAFKPNDCSIGKKTNQVESFYANGVEIDNINRPDPFMMVYVNDGTWSRNPSKTLLNGYPDKGDPVWSVCITEEQEVLIGSATGIRRYTTKGDLVWYVHLSDDIFEIRYTADRKKVIAYSRDGTIKAFDMETGKILFSVMMDAISNSAAVMLENGYYSGSGDILNKIGWHVNKNNIDTLFITPSLLYDVFYRPDIVKARLLGRPIEPLVGKLNIDMALKNPPPIVHLEKLSETIDTRLIKVNYKIESQGGGVAEVRVFQNGKLVMSDGLYRDSPQTVYAPPGLNSNEASRYANNRNASRVNDLKQTNNGIFENAVRVATEKTCNPSCSGSIEIEPLPGQDNNVTVVAFNKDNTIQSIPSTINFKSTLPKEEPHLWLIVVGINEFQSVSSLNNARKDAEDFACTYSGLLDKKFSKSICNARGIANGLFKKGNIHLAGALFDKSATKNNILAKLSDVAKQAKTSDTFILFIASHGVMDGNSVFGVVTHDSRCLVDDCTKMEGQITSNELLDASKNIKAMNQLIVLDTCHSGGLDHQLSGLYDARISVLARNMGLHLFASAQATEAALDGAPGTNGVFTSQLLAGVSGAAQKDSTGNITIVSLGDYAKRQTMIVTNTSVNKPQQSPLIQHFGRDAPLARSK